MHDDTPITNPIPGSYEKVANVYEKFIYENDAGMIVTRREIIRGNYTEKYSRFMGMATLNMQFENGQVQQILREFHLSFETLDKCFLRYMETLTASIPVIQEQIKQEMIQAQKQQSRIITAQKKFNFGAPDARHGR